MRYNHVYLPKEGWVILGDHVTLESGSGCVHTAGGHGVDDFNVCQKYPQVPITVPVDDGGYLTELAGKYAGQRVWAANKTILADLTASGAVMGQVHIKHQYPHCWRCHHPSSSALPSSGSAPLPSSARTCTRQLIPSPGCRIGAMTA